MQKKKNAFQRLYRIYLKVKSRANLYPHLKSYILLGLAAIRIEIGIVVLNLASCIEALYVLSWLKPMDSIACIAFI